MSVQGVLSTTNQVLRWYGSGTSVAGARAVAERKALAWINSQKFRGVAIEFLTSEFVNEGWNLPGESCRCFVMVFYPQGGVHTGVSVNRH